MIIATAGHVDHGKTTLLHALTGIHADRLPEEKSRGMTVDLGYAFLPLDNGSTLGFIDVPGHEKFLSNMLAGVGGIQHALLVVACDDGIMPQTREHLAILRLANIPAITVVLTKADRVDEQQINLVRQQMIDELVNQGWENSSFFVTSATEQSGIKALRQHLSQLTAPPISKTRRFRLAIDRAFTIKGSGLVVTGTALNGEVNVGDTLWLTGSNQPVKVRGLHAQNQPVDNAIASQRLALNITGDVSKQSISRGDWLLSQQPSVSSERVLVNIDSDDLIKHWQSVHLYHAASHITGRISLLEANKLVKNTQGLAEVILDKPLYLAEQDRIIIRDINARKTLGAATVLALNSPRRGKRQAAFLTKLTQISQFNDDLSVFALRLADGPVSLSQFAWERQLSESGLKDLLACFNGLVINNTALLNSTIEQLHQKVLATLGDFHQHNGDHPGIGRARLRRIAFPAEPDALIFPIIDQMLSIGKIKQNQGWLHLPEYSITFTTQQQVLWLQIEQLLSADALWVRDIAQQLKQPEQEIRLLLKKATQLNLVTAIVKDRYYLTRRIIELANIARTLQTQHGAIRAIDFRNALAAGRKLAIQILEFFDRAGFTRRRGDDHIIRDTSLFSE